MSSDLSFRQMRMAKSLTNYLLFRKMRKPDGVDSNSSSKLAVPSSASRSRTPSRQRSQSADTPTPTPQNGIATPDFAASPTSGESSAAPTGLMRLQEKLARKEGAERPELVQAAVRRKSVLPKSGKGNDLGSGPAKAGSTVARVVAKPMYGASDPQISNAVSLASCRACR